MTRFAGRCSLIGLLLVGALTGCGGGGSSDEPAQTPTVSLSASDTDLLIGESVTLTWSSSHASSCSASGGWSGSKALSGSEVISSVSESLNYVLSCSSTAGTADAGVTVYVSSPEPTLSLTANRNLAVRGGTVVYTWASTNTDYCLATFGGGQELDPSGSLEVDVSDSFPDTTFYQDITCFGTLTQISRQLTLDVQTLAGSLKVPYGVIVDSDVNDPDAHYATNDTMSFRQFAPTYGQVAGYVNMPGAGPDGRSRATGDVSDFYEVLDATTVVANLRLPTVDTSLPVGQRDDADLYLYDMSGNLLDAAVGSGALETLELPSSGAPCVLEVRAVHGGMNYLLTMDDASVVSSLSVERLSADFIPDEAIVSLKASKVKAAAATSLSRIAGTDALARVSLASGTAVQSVRSRMAIASERTQTAKLTSLQERKLATLLAIKELRRNATVRYAVPNRRVKALDVIPNDSYFNLQRWYLYAASVPQAWDTTTGLNTTTIAIVDNGVLTQHPDLSTKFVNGYDFVSDPNGLDGDGIDADYSDPGLIVGAHPIMHGTHVSGIAAARSNNAAGVAGVSWNSKIMPVRVLDGLSGTQYDVLQGVRYAARMTNDSGKLPTRAADVINMSLGSDDACDAAEADLFAQVVAAGIAIVAASGNDSASTVSSPASCAGVIAVGASNSLNERAYYSNYGEALSVLAPGGDMDYDIDANGQPDGIYNASAEVLGSGLITSYEYLQGTSMAAPIVSGIYALMKSVKADLTPQTFTDYLESGLLSDDLGTPGWDAETGYGAINAAKAVYAAGGAIVPGPRPGLSPRALDFEQNLFSVDLKVRNAGSGTLTVISVAPQDAFLTVAPLDVDASGLGTYRVSIDRQGLPHSIFKGSVLVHTSAGDQTVPVVGSNYDAGGEPDGGREYITAVDAVTGAVVSTLPMQATGFFLNFRFDDVPPGTYIVRSGTDLNNDGDYCDAGELCGAYPNPDLPDPIDNTEPRTGIDIPIRITAMPPSGSGQ